MYVVKKENLNKLEHYGFMKTIYDYPQGNCHMFFKKSYLDLSKSCFYQMDGKLHKLVGIEFHVSRYGVFGYSLIMKKEEFGITQPEYSLPFYYDNLRNVFDKTGRDLDNTHVLHLMNINTREYVSINIKDLFVDLLNDNIIYEYDSYIDFIYNNI